MIKKKLFCWKGILCYQINKKGETRVINIVGSNNHGKQGFREISAKLLKADVLATRSDKFQSNSLDGYYAVLYQLNKRAKESAQA